MVLVVAVEALREPPRHYLQAPASAAALPAPIARPARAPTSPLRSIIGYPEAGSSQLAAFLGKHPQAVGSAPQVGARVGAGTRASSEHYTPPGCQAVAAEPTKGCDARIPPCTPQEPPFFSLRGNCTHPAGTSARWGCAPTAVQRYIKETLQLDAVAGAALGRAAFEASPGYVCVRCRQRGCCREGEGRLGQAAAGCTPSAC